MICCIDIEIRRNQFLVIDSLAQINSSKVFAKSINSFVSSLVGLIEKGDSLEKDR